MFHRIELRNFKKFKSSNFELHPDTLSLLAGGNNSGKSTFLQSLAVWDFCVTVLVNEKGTDSLLPGFTGQGIGLSDDEFSPILVPALSHLWTNLTNQVPGQDGYTLKIKAFWKNEDGREKYLETSLALANDRLFIKPTQTNLATNEAVPKVAFVPPFAGISAREQLMSVAQRRAMIGSGLVGAIIRNVLYDLERENQRKREAHKAESANNRIKNSDLRRLRETDPWEQLQSAMGRYFQTSVSVEPFNDLYHTFIRVKLIKGEWNKTRIVKFQKFKPRDLMAEGSGFLQWLSVFALALDPNVDVLLLDEPDAHLHSSMQTLLISELEKISERENKQILLATHSTEILRWAYHEKILRFSGMKANYLGDEDGKIGLFAGLGSDFSPKLDRLRKSKKLLLVENESDARFLQIFGASLGIDLPDDIVVWPWTGSSKERKQLFLQLKKEISELKAISIRDRDNLEQNLVDPNTLQDKTEKDHSAGGLYLRVWQRRHIENYLIVPSAIARISGVDEQEVRDFLANNHGIVVPADVTAGNILQPVKDAYGKDIIETNKNSIESKYGCTKFDIANGLNEDEVASDIKVIINQMCSL